MLRKPETAEVLSADEGLLALCLLVTRPKCQPCVTDFRRTPQEVGEVLTQPVALPLRRRAMRFRFLALALFAIPAFAAPKITVLPDRPLIEQVRGAPDGQELARSFRRCGAPALLSPHGGRSGA